MLLTFLKYSQLIYSTILFILFLGSNTIADPNDREFIKLCKDLSGKLNSEMSKSATEPLYKFHTLVADKEQFAKFIVEKVKFLAKNLREFIQKVNRLKKKTVDKNLFFDKNALKFINTINENTKKPAAFAHEILDRIFVLDEKPNQFFLILDQLLWKIENDKKENGEIPHDGGTDHPMGKYIEARKTTNKYIKQLKIEIVYGQDIGAINEIGGIYLENKGIFKDNFGAMKIESKAKKFVKSINKEEIEKLMKEIQEKNRELKEMTGYVQNLVQVSNLMKKNQSEKFEEKFMEISKKEEVKDIPRKYNELYLYNLLNNAIFELQKKLVELVAVAVDGKKNKIDESLNLIELIVKPKLRQVFEEAITLPDTSETEKFVEAAVGSDKIMKNTSNSSINSSKKGKITFKYDLVGEIEKNLGLPQEFLYIEPFIVKKGVDNEHGMAMRKSKIRIAAAKLLLVFERLKKMYYEKEELNDFEKKNPQEMIDNLSQPIQTETFGEILGKYLLPKH